MSEIAIEILRSSHLEHFKLAKDLAMIYPVDHPRRRAIEKSMSEILNKIHNFEKEIKEESKNG